MGKSAPPFQRSLAVLSGRLRGAAKRIGKGNPALWRRMPPDAAPGFESRWRCLGITHHKRDLLFQEPAVDQHADQQCRNSAGSVTNQG